MVRLFPIACSKCSKVIQNPVQVSPSEHICSSCTFKKLDLTSTNFLKELIALLSSKFRNISISQIGPNNYLLHSEGTNICNIEFNTNPTETLINKKLSQIKSGEPQFNLYAYITIENNDAVGLIREFKRRSFRKIILN